MNPVEAKTTLETLARGIEACPGFVKNPPYLSLSS